MNNLAVHVREREKKKREKMDSARFGWLVNK
jgi:hypothetical protein